MSFKSISTVTASLIVALSFSACNNDETKTVTETIYVESNDSSYTLLNAPRGMGYTQTVSVPNVSYPLPSILYAQNNADSSTKYSISNNPVAAILSGLNGVYKSTTDDYQDAASGNGPSASDYEEDPIIDADTWEKNIAYVIDVTTSRTDSEAILAFLDDRRSKNYSVIDGYGPLTEDYVEASGAYTDITAPTKAQVLEDEHYLPDSNDNIIFAGSEESTLGAVYKLVYDFRQVSPASTSGTKYLFGTPRPWRMNDTGAIDFLGTTSEVDASGEYTGSDGSMYSGTYACTNTSDETSYYIFDQYTSSVDVVAGLRCARRKHKSSKEGNATQVEAGDKIYSADTSNARKDNGYPSGHTNAGYLAALAYAYALPERFSEMVVRASQLGEDRIVAGMHSPVDVIGARMMALSVASFGLNQTTIAQDAQEAVEATGEYFGDKADAADMTLYEYAHQSVEYTTDYLDEDNSSMVNVEVFDNNIYDDHDTMKALYKERMTYGLSQDTTQAGAEPIVPEGAEVLIASRFPYLSAAQRRAVLATTEIDSGYPILDDSNGWGRINLFDAADGYGAFDGDVYVVMDAQQGRFSAVDAWRNDISGAGKLSKSGTGALTLTGDNTYTGGTIINEGTLEAASATAFGTGDVYMTGGATIIDSEGLEVAANYTQTSGALEMVVDASTKLEVSEIATIAGGTLEVTFADDYTPTAGTSLELISSKELNGEFTSVEVDGFSVETTYSDTTLTVTLVSAN